MLFAKHARFCALLAFGALVASPAWAGKAKILYGFCQDQEHCSDGEGPQAAMVADSAGVLYGTTFNGGEGSAGTVFAMVPKKKSAQHKVIYNFTGLEGRNPHGKLVLDVSGNLYGTLSDNNSDGSGSVFELIKGPHNSWTYKELYAFCSLADCADGRELYAGLTYAGAESGAPYDGTSPLYGAATSGGSQGGGGVVYQLKPKGDGTWTESALHSFCVLCGKEGTYPTGQLYVSPAGHVFGATASGGTKDTARGTVFELEPKGGGDWKLTTLYNFCSATNCTDGALPNGVTADASGALYGTTYMGGAGSSCFDANSCGVVFKLVPNGKSSVETTLYSFCSQAECADGYLPVSELALDDQGSLYGTTKFGGDGASVEGGVFGGGVVFKLDATGTFTVVQSLCSANNCKDGGRLEGGVTLTPAGIYGVTAERGPNFFGGTVFRLKQKK